MATNIGKIHVIFQLITNFILVAEYDHLGFALQLFHVLNQ